LEGGGRLTTSNTLIIIYKEHRNIGSYVKNKYNYGLTLFNGRHVGDKIRQM